MAFAADISASLPGLLPVPPPVVGRLSGIASAPKTAKTKVVDQREAIAAQGALLSLDLIRDGVEECLLQSVREATGDLSALMADSELLDSLRRIFGKRN